eukprot:9374235-Karenia_brevis.AAC.1
MDTPNPEAVSDGKMTQEVRDKQNDIPYIWPIEFGGDTNPGERMRTFDNSNEMQAKWKSMPISE